MPARLALGHRVGGTGCERSRIRHDKLLPQRPASRNLWRRRYCSSRKDRVRHVRLCCWDPLFENGVPVVRRHSPEGVARHAGTGGNSTDSGRLSALVFIGYGRNRADHRSWLEGMTMKRLHILVLVTGVTVAPILVLVAAFYVGHSIAARSGPPALRSSHRPRTLLSVPMKNTPCPMK